MTLAIVQLPKKKKKQSLDVCEGLIPGPQTRTYAGCIEMYWQYCTISSSSTYIFGTVGESVPSQDGTGKLCVEYQEMGFYLENIEESS
jgi:hypothetical protein